MQRDRHYRTERIRGIKAQYATAVTEVETALKKVEASCLASISEAETAWKEVETSHLASINEAETLWAASIQCAEIASMAQASKIHLQLHEAMRCLDEEALREEKQAQQSLSYGLWHRPPGPPK